MNWFTLSLSSVFVLAIAELSQQSALNRNKPLSLRANAVLVYFIQSIVVFPFSFFVFRKEFFDVFSPDLLVKFLAVTAIGSIATIFYLKSLKVQNISLSGIFGSLSVVVSTILGIYFFDEGTSLIKFIGIIMILTAIISLNFRNAILERNHMFGLISGLLFGICYVLDKSIVQAVNPVVYLFWSFLTLSLFCFLANPKEVAHSLGTGFKKSYRLIAIAAICYALYNFLTISSYLTGGEVGKIDAINNSQIFLIILFEYFILKHHDSIFRKFATALVAFSGIYLLGTYV